MKCFMDHIVLNVENEDKMIDFYSKILNLASERLEEYRAGKAPFPSVRINADTIIDFFPKKIWQGTLMPGQGQKNLNHFCIALSKKRCLTLMETLKINKIEIEEGPARRWGAHGTGTSIYFRDPDNNLIEARYYEEN